VTRGGATTAITGCCSGLKTQAHARGGKNIRGPRCPFLCPYLRGISLGGRSLYSWPWGGRSIGVRELTESGGDPTTLHSDSAPGLDKVSLGSTGRTNVNMREAPDKGIAVRGSVARNLSFSQAAPRPRNPDQSCRRPDPAKHLRKGPQREGRGESN